jgi:PAS domain S-box-containing protein
MAELSALRKQVESLEGRQRELTSLLRASQAVTSSLDQNQTLSAIVHQAAAISGCDGIRLFLLDEASRVLRCRVGVGLPPEEVEGLEVPLANSFSGQVATTGEPLAVADIRGDPRIWRPEVASRYGHVSYLGLPVKVAACVLGVLVFSTASPRAYTQDEIGFLTAFADRAALALEQARLYAQEQERRQQLEAVRAVCGEVTRELDLPTLLELITRRAAELVGVQSGTVLLWDEQVQRLIPKTWYGRGEWVKEFCPRLGQGIVGSVAQQRQGMIVNDYRTSPYAHPLFLHQLSLTAVLAEPLVYRDRLLGVITMSNEGTGRPFMEQDRQTVSLFAAHAAIAIENARLYEAAQRELAQRRQAEEALQESEERYQRITRAVTDYIYAVRVEDGRPVETSHGPGCVAVTGYTSAEFGADPHLWLRMVDELDRPTVVEQARRVLTGEDSQPLEHRIIRKDGARRWVRNTPVPHFDAQGRLLGYDGLIQDITDRKHADEALQVRTQQLDAVRAISEEIAKELDLTTLLSLIVRRAKDLVETNTGTIHLWDEITRTLIPKAWFGFGAWRGDVRLRLGEGVAGTVALRREGLMVNDFRASPYALPIFLERTTYTAVLTEPLLYRDRLVGVISITREKDMRPFTQEDRETLSLFAAQAAIAIENARLHTAALRRGAELEALLRAARSIMSGLDLQGILDRIVEEAVRSTGCSHVKLLLVDKESGMLRVGALLGTALPPDFQLPLNTSLSGLVVQTGQPVFRSDAASDPENVLANQDREAGVVTYLGLPVKGRKEILGVLTFNTKEPRQYAPEELAYLTSFADHAAIAIENAHLFAELNQSYESLQRAQEELIRSEKLRALGQMSAGIAHDLNNMLAAILGQVELLRLRVTDPEVQTGLATLETAATDGAHVVRRLQDFARQRTHSSLRPLDLRPVIAEALAITRPRWEDEAQRRGVAIAIQTHLEDCPPILGHAPEIREILTNLILNAVDAMPHGGTLCLATRSVASTRDEIPRSGSEPPAPSSRPSIRNELVELSVTDTGIGMAESVRQRVFEPFFTTKGGQGTGLGLSVAYGIMERHGGRIEVASAPGQGTTVSLRFAIASQDAAPMADTSEGPATPRHLLLIDDDVMVRQTLAALLRTAGHSVQEADGGVAGLDLLTRATVDVVFTDLGMPEVTGWDVARAVKARTPRLPVVLLTGWGEQVAGEPGAEGLVECVLSKPVRLEDLLRVIADLTRLK